MPHYRKLYPSNYIGEFDLDGKEATLTIETVAKVPVYVPQSAQNEDKVVMTFKEARKHWIVNRTNADRIAAQHGEETDNWPGKQITLMPAKTKVGRKTVPCVRVKVIEKKLTEAP